MRYWRAVGNFHTVGTVTEAVTAPNWQGAMRKGVLQLKRNQKLKGKKITAASFTLQEISAEEYNSFAKPSAVQSPLPQVSQAEVEK